MIEETKQILIRKVEELNNDLISYEGADGELLGYMQGRYDQAIELLEIFNNLTK